MKILYGVCGEGFGHSSRALVLADYLEKKGHEVIILTHGQAYNVLKGKFKCFKVKGLHLIFEKSVLKKRKTVNYNLRNFTRNFYKWKNFDRLMKKFNPDLCISDMEPIVPVLRNWYNKPLICFDNQHRLTNLELRVPKQYATDFFLAKSVVETFVKRADYFVITSFSKNQIKKRFRKNTFVVSPPIRGDVRKIKPNATYKGKILVYLTKKDRQRIKILKSIKEAFAVYGYNKDRKQGNIEFRTREHFLEDLKDCKAIISTAGFTLMSEAIYLKKPYFALPLKGQFEQTMNALLLKEAEFGEYSEDLTKKQTENFLKNLEKYKGKLKEYKLNPDELFKVFDKVLMSI
ncbi:hypothetical protein A3K73_00425 [Candidatus Pacearchaeota archaeon RBG_13_36_9]|nr:MAG: hypothetical protein A3K73_00425 [Candidatus Pacearchaeota archaeon RBG_13_36_9]